MVKITTDEEMTKSAYASFTLMFGAKAGKSYKKFLWTHMQ
jgi:hypothetical protein